MFEKLFAESGLSLDRLRSLLEVGAAGSIARAANGDPVRQSQYSRQIKELEDFFRIRLIERHGKGTRMTGSGKELARISRFFMLGLSNFKRGCLAGEQTFRIGASATFVGKFLLPVISLACTGQGAAAYAIETAADEEIERRLHDLTLDFGVTSDRDLSRPLQSRLLLKWKLQLWVPKAMGLSQASAERALKERRLPLVLARKELGETTGLREAEYEAQLACESFLEAAAAAGNQRLAVFLPDFLTPEKASRFVCVRLSDIEGKRFGYRLAWNPRLLRLNPHTVRRRDWLAEALSRQGGQERPSSAKTELRSKQVP